MYKKLFAILVFWGCVLIVSPVAADVQAEEAGSMVAPADCPVNVPESREVECGYLLVPADRTDPESPILRLPYILMHSRNPNPAPDPIIFTSGGPGYSSLDSIWGFVNSPMSDERDVIVFEQRGNRFAVPALTCDHSFWWAEEENSTPCLDAFREKGIDLGDYTSQNIASDVVALRQALGYEQWNLYGTSYSTTIMLLVMEKDSTAVRSAILQSVRPPQLTIFNHEADHVLRSINLLFRDCAADPECTSAYPELEDQFFDLIRQLNDNPIEIWVDDAFLGEKVPVTVDGNLFISWVMVDSFYKPSFLPAKTPYLPLMIHELSAGNQEPLKAWTQEYWSGMLENQNWALGLLLGVNCQEALGQAGSQLSPEDKEASDLLDGYRHNKRSREICKAWNLQPVPPPAAEPISVETPTLILAGSYDPITPSEWSSSVAADLPNSQYFEFKSAGHEVTMNNPCAQKLQADFINNPTALLDDSCMADVPGPSFVLPSDIYTIPGLYNSPNEVELDLASDRGIPWLEALFVASLLLMVASLMGLIILGVMRLAQKRWRPGRPGLTAILAYFLAAAVIVIALAVPVLTTTINNYYFDQDSLVRTFGAGRDYLPATLLALATPLTLLLVLALAGLVIWAWSTGRWWLPLRLITSTVVIAAVPLLYLGLRWGLFSMLV